tara:strand:+ start:193 stop:1578 length:1386 start_codon:yes stop_codon:yes gene_type:complete
MITSKTQIKPATVFKVDNLRHISDHGMSVEFSCPRLAEFVRQTHALQDGTVKIKAGESRLTIVRLGHVTKTMAFFSVGSRFCQGIHYLADGMKHTVNKNGTGSLAFEILDAVLFGEPLPHVFVPNSGEKQDQLREVLKKDGWALCGESGIRAMALEGRVSRLKEDVRSARNSAHYAERQLEMAKAITPETCSTDRAKHRAWTLEELAKIETLTQTLTQTLTGLPTLAGASLESLASGNGAWKGYGDSEICFPSKVAGFSHELIRANYLATVEGDRITLSSGIVCAFGVNALSSWLRGETSAPRTQYGSVSRLDGRDDGGNPISLLQCGCHRIAIPENCAELRALLTPKHSVISTPGEEKIGISAVAPFRARLAEKLAEKLAELKERRSSAIEREVRKRDESHKAESEIPENVAKAQMDFDKENERLSKALAAQELPSLNGGATLERVFSVHSAIVSAFSRF